ncbi:MAG: YgaP family membrane protein [Sulfuriferula sp.]
MTVERTVRIIAGLFIMISLLLAHLSGTVDMSHISWLWLTAFVGFNLFQSGITRFCPMDIMLKKAGVKTGCGL